jgi:hypothetical protein
MICTTCGPVITACAILLPKSRGAIWAHPKLTDLATVFYKDVLRRQVTMRHLGSMNGLQSLHHQGIRSLGWLRRIQAASLL